MSGLTPPDALVRPACEVALEVARVGLRASPPITVPRALRPFVRFARLSDHAVATVRRVLDEDEAFRRHVCATVDIADLGDELDEPSLLFLRRPAGWEHSLAEHVEADAAARAAERAAKADVAAGRQLELAKAALERVQGEVAPLREALGGLRAEVADERRRRRTAESDLGRLRKRIADLEAAAAEQAAPPADERPTWVEALAAAEARAEAAEARADEAQARADEASARADAADRALEVAAHVDVAASSERSIVGGPDAWAADAAAVAAAEAVADAVRAVGALADALGRAARELGATALGEGAPSRTGTFEQRRQDDDPSGRAGRDSRRRGPARKPVPLPPAVFDDAPEAVDHLLRVPRALVLVDGYNVTLSARGELALADQRRWLLDAAAGLAARTGATFQVVFDGDDAASAPSDRSRHLGVHVRFTAAGVEADDVLLALVDELPQDQPAVVVSDDRRVRDGARRLGANVLGVGQLVDALRR